MTRIIKVEPFGRDWRVHNETLGEDMMFQSGAAAEAAARVLADVSARRGQSAEVRIRLRDGWMCSAQYPAGAPGFRSAEPTPTPAALQA
jgi:hypothetical protein